MFLALENPYKLGTQLKRPNQGFAVDSAKNNFTIYSPVRYHLQSHHQKRSCTFPRIRKKLPIRQFVVQGHFDGGETFVFSLDGKKMYCENKRKPSGTLVKFSNRSLST